MNLVEFVRESNKIERINRNPTQAEVEIHRYLLAQRQVSVALLEQFVNVVTDGAPLRRHQGLNAVIAGTPRMPPPGGPQVAVELENLLDTTNRLLLSPYTVHVAYERLHPFMDGNGRSGRALWAWQMTKMGDEPFALPFLHRFYYQCLSE